MKRIIVASQNPVKLTVARKAFVQVFPGVALEVVAVQTNSGVPAQPFEGEVLQGAMHRLAQIRDSHPKADYWISQEGGLFRDTTDIYHNRAWIVVCDRQGHVAKSSTASFALPKGIAALVATGLEFGDASDVYWNTTGLKQGAGGLGHITDGLIDRTQFYVQAAIIAFSAVKHHHLFS